MLIYSVQHNYVYNIVYIYIYMISCQFYCLFDVFLPGKIGQSAFKNRKWLEQWLGIYQPWGGKCIIELGHVVNPIWRTFGMWKKLYKIVQPPTDPQLFERFTGMEIPNGLKKSAKLPLKWPKSMEAWVLCSEHGSYALSTRTNISMRS